MKKFKEILKEADSRFGTPEDPRLNIHDPLYNRTSAYDPEHAATMAAVANMDSDYIPPPMRTGGKHGGANTVIMDPNAERRPTLDTFHSFKKMTQAEIAKLLGYKDTSMIKYIQQTAIKKLLAGLQDDPKLKELFAGMVK